MYYQNETPFLDVIKKEGCFFISCVNAVEYASGVRMTFAQVNETWNECKELGYINHNNDIVNSANIMNHILVKFNSGIRIVEVATKRDGREEKYNGVGFIMRPIYIMKVKTSNKNTHFMLVDKNDNIIFDPWRGGVRVIDKYYTIVYDIKRG